MHSLKKRFQNKVKLIYIDPPYNTGGDANIFTYNNNFNHSSWLTFMKNRLEVAKDLLKDDGFITIAIDHYELFYLGVLADEIFGRENRLGIVTIVHKPEGRQTTDFFNPTNEFMLVYSKDRKKANFLSVAITNDIKKSFDLKDDKGLYKLKSYLNNDMMERVSREKKPNFWYPIYVSKNLKEITLTEREDFFKILPVTNNGLEKTWQTVRETTEKRIENNELVAVNENNKVNIYYKFREQERFKTHWIDKKYNATANGTNLLSKILGRTKSFSYPKSVYVIQDVLKIMTDKGDIILDFFAGSGTTGHAVLQQNKEDGGSRKFILVEQLDEHAEICKERIQKVLKKEKIDDDFVYFELMRYNEGAIDKIYAVEDSKELLSVWDEMCDKYFLNYNVRIKAFNENKEEFEELNLEEQKKILIEMLNKNQLYVNLSEINDSQFKVSEEDKRLNKEFYDAAFSRV